MNFKKLTITHNFGTCVLENGTINDEGMAVGTCTAGGDTERLMWATKHTPYETGVEKKWPLYKQKPYESAPGEFRINTQTCG